MKKSQKDLDAQAKALRAKGASYKEIAIQLGVNPGKIWIICNRERHRENSNESAARYRARGYTSLA